jgi:hypothetical protein
MPNHVRVCASSPRTRCAGCGSRSSRAEACADEDEVVAGSATSSRQVTGVTSDRSNLTAETARYPGTATAPILWNTPVSERNSPPWEHSRSAPGRFSMLRLTDPEVQYTAILGDLQHKQDVYLVFGTFGLRVERFFSRSHQASYLRQHHPSLVPPGHPNGTPPSEHTVSTAFEYYYYSRAYVRTQYLQYVRRLFEHDI